MGTPRVVETQMTEKAGEMTREGADYRCERCRRVVSLPRGVLLPVCPSCGHDTFDLSNPRFEGLDGSLGPHDPG
jgi:Zn finger protein HypA/HybF involved in hydrogenase expression